MQETTGDKTISTKSRKFHALLYSKERIKRKDQIYLKLYSGNHNDNSDDGIKYQNNYNEENKAHKANDASS